MHFTESEVIELQGDDESIVRNFNTHIAETDKGSWFKKKKIQ